MAVGMYSRNAAAAVPMGIDVPCGAPVGGFPNVNTTHIYDLGVYGICCNGEVIPALPSASAAIAAPVEDVGSGGPGGEICAGVSGPVETFVSAVAAGLQEIDVIGICGCHGNGAALSGCKARGDLYKGNSVVCRFVEVRTGTAIYRVRIPGFE